MKRVKEGFRSINYRPTVKRVKEGSREPSVPSRTDNRVVQYGSRLYGRHTGGIGRHIGRYTPPTKGHREAYREVYTRVCFPVYIYHPGMPPCVYIPPGYASRAVLHPGMPLELFYTRVCLPVCMYPGYASLCVCTPGYASRTVNNTRVCLSDR